MFSTRLLAPNRAYLRGKVLIRWKQLGREGEGQEKGGGGGSAKGGKERRRGDEPDWFKIVPAENETQQ